MNTFSKLFNKVLGKPDPDGPVPGPMGKILSQMGIHEIGPAKTGIPLSVLMGCKKEHVLIPGASRPSYTREGKPVIAKNEHGKEYHVMENYAVTKKMWKSMQNDQKRKAEGRWYSGAKVAA